MVTRRETIRPKRAVESGRRERRREQTAEKLFRAAAELFARKGYAATTVEEITEAADVGKGTFFNYFPSKEHVLTYFVERQRGALHRHLLLARENKSEIVEILLSLADELVLAPSGSQHLARSLIAAFLGSVEVRERIAREMGLGRKIIAEIIAMGIEAGALHSELAPAELARSFQQTLIGSVLLWSMGPHSSIKKRLRLSMSVLFSGLGATPSSLRACRRRIGEEAR
jgi:AcrR family transcriptional regulator